MLDLVPKKLFLTKGKGVHEDRLTSFEYALRDAGIAGTNLVLISSIFPPEAKLISRHEGLKLIKPGQILFTIYSKNQTKEPHRLTAASVGVAQPKDPNHYGYLSEYDSMGKPKRRPEIMQKTLLLRCLHHLWGFLLILTKAGTKKGSNGPSQVKFTKQQILPKQQLVTNKDDGQLFLLQQYYLFETFVLNPFR